MQLDKKIGSPGVTPENRVASVTYLLSEINEVNSLRSLQTALIKYACYFVALVNFVEGKVMINPY